ncbi:MAG: 1-acyl-sn-glycerol-3-phosphate acyltransferase [Chryseolinea sp.]
MATLFVNLYDFFARRRPIFWVVFTTILLLFSYGAWKVELEEDITKFFPDDPRVQDLQDVFQNSKFVERMVMMVSAADTTADANPDSLVTVSDSLISRMQRSLGQYTRNISGRVDDDKILQVFKSVSGNLPMFLSDEDYNDLDSIVDPANIPTVMETNYRQLISPSGIALKRIITEDPLGISFLALRKFAQLQYDQNFELYDGYVVTKDHKNLIFFIEPTFGGSETKKNSVFIEKLSELTREMSSAHPTVSVSYFGATAVAVGNAQQLRKDSIITISIMVVLLCVLLVGFFRRKRAPLLILIPVIFGGLFALSTIYLFKGSVSVLALAAGSVILGIAVNYALHFLVHLRQDHNIREVIRELVDPLTLGSATTVLAFFCLQFANAAVLRDVGLFAALSLIGAALCTLIFLPHLVPETLFKSKQPATYSTENDAQAGRSEKWWAWSIFLITPIFFFLAFDVKFNTDMSKLNFMDAPTLEAQHHLESISKGSLGTMYVVSRGSDLEHALRKAEDIVPTLADLKGYGTINKFTSPTLFLISDSLQSKRIEKWKAYWSENKRQSVLFEVKKEASRLHFSDKVIDRFENMITRSYEPGGGEAFKNIRAAFFDNYIVEQSHNTTVFSLINADPSNKQAIYDRFDGEASSVVDRQMLTNLFVEYVHADFNFIVTITALLVFLALFLSYGRIELTLITFFPMFITWIWILGIMALLGIEFNIVNVMVSTFIFGLGDDYSIFIMDGLQQEFKTGKRTLGAIRISIILSAVTTIAGLGVLIFAKHPALRSIASISIIGIVCVLIMSQTIEPFLFRSLITNRTRKGLAPMTWVGMLRTLFTYTYFVVGAIILTIIGGALRIIPFARKTFRYIFHSLIRAFNWTLIYLEPNVSKRIINGPNGRFNRASLIIANHSSFLDALVITLLNPKLILLTNTWVWNSPVFGGVVRLADYYPVMEGAEDSVDQLRDRVSEGYSVVVFPEGKRSECGTIGRFHKGAFFMAEKLNIPIQPLLIHGTSDAIPKGSFYLNEGHITMKFLPSIESEDKQFGATYSERAKSVGKYFRQEFTQLKHECETPEYFQNKLFGNYLYKGPILEWYMRIKVRMERHYAIFHNLMPMRGRILDLGCGYGFLCYMLQFLSDERIITGVDYDESKIMTAAHGHSKTERLNFIFDDVTKFKFESYEGIVVSDVLHYLTPVAQEKLLLNCFDALQPGGILVVRDGNADLKKRHKGTKLTEFFSVRVLKFNKSVNELSFVSGRKIIELAKSRGLIPEVIDDAKFTSNVIFAFRKPL